MHTLAYEGRRLAGVRSTWLVLLATLAGAAVLTAVAWRHLPAGAVSAAQAAHRLTAAPGRMPFPAAAFGAGVLGALSYGHELRHPALCAALVPTARRLRLLAAKLIVIGAAAAVLTSATAVVDAAVLHVTAPGGLGRAAALPHLGGLPAAVLGPTALAAAAGWVALLASGVLRSSAAGLLALAVLVTVLVAVPTAAGTSAAGLLRRSGTGRGQLAAAASAPLALTLLSASALLVVWTALQLRRRTV